MVDQPPDPYGPLKSHSPYTDAVHEEIRAQAATINWLRWLCSIVGGIVLISGTAVFSLLWTENHDIAVLEATMPKPADLDVLRHENTTITNQIATLQSGTITRSEHEALINRIETLSAQLGIVTTNQQNVMRRLDNLEQHIWGGADGNNQNPPRH